MLFVTYRKIDDEAVMGTDYPSCISFDILDSQEDAGYYFKVNGKKMTARQVKSFFKNTEDVPVTATEVANDSTAENLMSDDNKKEKTKRKVRKIRCLNTNKIYNNMTACARDLGMDPAAISYAMQKNKPAKGYSFEFVE